MIINFEELTHELTKKELGLLPYLCSILLDTDEERPFDDTSIRSALNRIEFNGKPIVGSRLRKMIHCIRVNRILPVIGTKRGYFVSWNKEVLEKQITSLEQRARSIQEVADAMQGFLNAKT
jgi:hypothetical protein